jgi:hypothetical protein
MSIKIQVIFYSMYGHVYRMAEAEAEGAKQVLGAEVSLYQVPELIPDDVLENTVPRPPRPLLPRCQWPRSISLLRPTLSLSVRQLASET